MILAVDALDVVYDLAAAVDAEVHVYIRHGDALGVEKAFKKEAVFYGIDVRDVQAVGHDAARRAAAPRTDGDPVSFGIADEVRDDEKIVHKPHFFYHLQLIVELGVHLGAVGVALGKAFFAELAEIGAAVRLPLGEPEARKVIVPEAEVEIAALGNVGGVVRRLLPVREERAHLLLALEIQLLRFKAHAVGVVNGLAHLYAHQNVLIICVLLFYIVRVVCDDKGNARVLMERDKLRRGTLFVAYAVILYLKEEIPLAEKLVKLQRARLCSGIIAV